MARSYPFEWDKFCKIHKKYGGFTHYNLNAGVTIGDLNRFAARYALAKDFNGIDISHSTLDTRSGYEALMRSLFVWSVAESYHKLLPSSVGGKYAFLQYDTLEKSNLRVQLDATGTDMISFYTYISASNNLDSAHSSNVNDFLAGNDYNPTRLLSCIRHVFGHGELSANVNGVKPKSIETITTILKNLVLNKVDLHFIALVKTHPDYTKV
ncbi:hypothetical protein [Psychromonas sp. SP041]|uniref:hypothetical protein n=1 Tax=Psychromonas sp. SP041 TaxID=1365007 RepID=UPI0004115207|nr:hypothetical protein [Psychromonas sp. SP041]